MYGFNKYYSPSACDRISVTSTPNHPNINFWVQVITVAGPWGLGLGSAVITEWSADLLMSSSNLTDHAEPGEWSTLAESQLVMM
jgi:hypothetical protein